VLAADAGARAAGGDGSAREAAGALAEALAETRHIAKRASERAAAKSRREKELQGARTALETARRRLADAPEPTPALEEAAAAAERRVAEAEAEAERGAAADEAARAATQRAAEAAVRAAEAAHAQRRTAQAAAAAGLIPPARALLDAARASGDYAQLLEAVERFRRAALVAPDYAPAADGLAEATEAKAGRDSVHAGAVGAARAAARHADKSAYASAQAVSRLAKQRAAHPTVRVTLRFLRGASLPVGDPKSGSSDPFVEVVNARAGGARADGPGGLKPVSARTKTKKKTLNPEWSEKEGRVSVDFFDLAEMRGATLAVRAWDWDAGLANNDLLSEGAIALGDSLDRTVSLGDTVRGKVPGDESGVPVALKTADGGDGGTLYVYLTAEKIHKKGR
jgi:negative regulator of replication initiation